MKEIEVSPRRVHARAWVVCCELNTPLVWPCHGKRDFKLEGGEKLSQYCGTKTDKPSFTVTHYDRPALLL